MEQIYTIPINETFEACAQDTSIGCPICALYNKLEDNELETILGASMMEPDVRIKTNKQGFCRTHYDMMLQRKNRLGMALTLESHLDELRKSVRYGAIIPGANPTSRTVAGIDELEKNCYVCSKIAYHFDRMTDNIIMLWDQDPDFPAKLASQPYFCLPHYKMLLTHAKSKLPSKKYARFACDCANVVEPYFDELRGDVSWFCKKFDYRYEKEPWNNSKDAVERAVKFLRSDLHKPPISGKDKK